MCGRKPYESERAADPTRRAGEGWTSDARRKTLAALNPLGEELPPGEPARLVCEDPDP